MVVKLQKHLQDQLCVINQQPLSVAASAADYVNQYPSLLAQTLLLASNAAQLSPSPPEMTTPQQGSNGSMNGMDTGGSPSSSHSNSNEMNGGDAEGVWSADIDQAFHEALEIYPPCGRRKIILSEEGKMYGRNELIARYIKLRCGKTRTRKQVSSHIQVLARKQNREKTSKVKAQEIKVEDPQTSASFGSPHKSAADSAFHAASRSTAVAISAAASMANFPNVLATSMAAAGSLEAQQTKLKSLADAAGVTSALLPPAAAALKREDVSPAAFSAAAAASAVGNPAVSAMSALQWPYTMMPGMFNNNVYGNMAGMSNDENLFITAALSAQQQMNAFSPSAAAATSAAPAVSAAPNPLSAAAMDLPALGRLLPSLLPNFPANGLFNANAAALNVLDGQTSGAVGMLAERSIASSKLVLCGFTAYLERTNAEGTTERINIMTIPQFSEDPLEMIHLEEIKDKFPPVLEELFRSGPPEAFYLVKCWANVAFDIDENDQSSLYAVDSFYDSTEDFEMSISSRVCSFGEQQVEKVEIYSATESSGESNNPQRLHHYRLEHSAMCEYMTVFMKKLKNLDDHQKMNCVLENFTVLQVVTNKQTGETLMVIAFTFEVSPEPESSCRVYKLIE